MENVWLLQRFLWVCTRSLFQFSLSVQRIWKPFASIQLMSACHAVFRMDCYIAWTAVYPVMPQTFVTALISLWVRMPLLVCVSLKWKLGYCVPHNVLYFVSFTLSVQNRGILKSTLVKSLKTQENDKSILAGIDGLLHNFQCFFFFFSLRSSGLSKICWNSWTRSICLSWLTPTGPLVEVHLT